jgi:hypothetical protein
VDSIMTRISVNESGRVIAAARFAGVGECGQEGKNKFRGQHKIMPRPQPQI